MTGLVKGTGTAPYGNRDLLSLKSHEIVHLGVGRTFQTATVFEQLSVVQNLDIAAGLHRSKRTRFAPGAACLTLSRRRSRRSG